MRYPSALAASSVLRCMFLTHTKTQWIIIMSAHYLCMTTSSWTIHFSPIHSSRMGLQPPFLMFSSCFFVLGAAELLGYVLGWEPEPRPLADKNFVFIYCWSGRICQWENWVTASEEQQLTHRDWYCLEKAAVDCAASAISLNEMSHNTGTTLILTAILHCHQSGSSLHPKKVLWCFRLF